MLKFFRKKNIARLVLWSLLILILPAFVLWGTGMGGSKNKGPTFVGVIDNRKVSFDDLGLSIMSIRGQILLNYFNQPEMMEKLSKNNPFIAKMAWDRLLMLKEANKNKIKVPDDELIRHIRSHPIFNRSGSFDDHIYAYVLKNNIGMSARVFEEMMRENMKIQRLQDTIAKDVKTADEKNKALEDWLKALEAKASLNIDFNDYEKYYK